MTVDPIIRAFREQPQLHASFLVAIEEQRAKILARVASAPDAPDLYRLQGELRALTNLVSHFKTMLGNSDARTSKAA